MYIAPSRSWTVPALTTESNSLFIGNRNAFGYLPASIVAHGSLLINLASADPLVRQKSIGRMIIEIERARTLGIEQLVVHPGSNPDFSEGMDLATGALQEIIFRTKDVVILLETVAGQGNSIGWRFEHLRDLIDKAPRPERLGVCFDTCHVFAAGYNISGASSYASVMSEFDRIVGADKIRAFHVNDSKTALGSRVDRHAELVGSGFIGAGMFHALLHDPRFEQLPMIAEVPDGEHLTAANITRLKELRTSDHVVDGGGQPRSLFA